MAQEIPFTSDDPFYDFNTTLDGVRFLFDVRWNDRDSAWYFDLANEDGVVLRHGIKIVLGMPLARRSASAEMPAGWIVALDTSGKGVDATVDDLGTRVIVVFFTDAEVAAL